MAFDDITDPKAVQCALDEFDMIGRVEFLTKYGFGKARGWTIVRGNGGIYDAKAILGAAHGYQFPDSGSLTPYDFFGGEPTARKLRSMGFVVDEPSTSPRNPVWSRDELILALDLYMRHRASLPNESHPNVIELSEFLNQLGALTGSVKTDRFRNANGVAMKLQNLSRLDPLKEGRGLPGGGKGEQEVWDTFANDPQRLEATVEAIRALVLHPEAIPDLGEDEGEEAEEGRILTRLHRFRERDRRIVAKRKAKALKEHGVLRCEACEFDFSRRYGLRGSDFIECHHTKAVSSLQPGGKTKLDELVLLCANCHRMIHIRRPWLTIEELKSVIV